jgi:thioredoxin reductase
VRGGLEAARVPIETRTVTRLVVASGGEKRLAAIELADGTRVEREVLFAHPPQRQVDLVRALGLELDDDGYVKIDPMKRETSRPGVYAAGDLASRQQAAIFAAAAGTQAAAVINVDVTMELSTRTRTAS